MCFGLRRYALCDTYSAMKPTPGIYTTEKKNLHQSGSAAEWLVHHFKFEGRTYTIEKRARGDAGARDWFWYTCFAIRGRRYHRSLETNNRDAAVDRAISQIIKPAKAGDSAKLEASKLKRKVSTLADVFALYPKLAMVKHETVRNNMGALLLMFEWVRGEKPAPGTVKLDEVTKDLVRKFQSALVEDYVKRAGAEERSARELALRSSRSIFNQAKSLFNREKDLVDQYRSAGLVVPPCVIEFRDFRPLGKLSKELFFPPDDGVIRKTFAEIEGLKVTQPDVYLLFWLCVGTGMRRREAAGALGEHLVERDGRLWVAGGMGKDGKEIQIPVIHHLLKEYTGTSPQEVLRAARRPGFLLPGDARMRQDTVPYKLNLWLESLGWKDEKKMHALRAFVGSKIFEIDPRTAQYYLRHKSLTTTEKYYSHFSKLKSAVERL